MKRIKSAIKIILCCLLCIGTASSLTSCTKKKTEETNKEKKGDRTYDVER